MPPLRRVAPPAATPPGIARALPARRGAAPRVRPTARPRLPPPGATPDAAADLAAVSLPPGTVVDELPLFPLSLVAFPSADVPLHVFEARWAG